MRKVVFAINMTADGFCGHEDGVADDELHEMYTGLLRTAGVILFGRITYQLMVPYWPDVARTLSADPSSNEFARVFDALDKIVFSKTLQHIDDTRTKLVRGPVVEEVLALRTQSGKDIAVGSLSLASQLSAHGLIDEYRIAVHPVIAGRGPRLFDAVKLHDRIRLALLGARTLRSGVVALHYGKS